MTGTVAPSPAIAGRAVVTEPPGGAIRVSLQRREDVLAFVDLGPADACALAADLLAAARVRMGRHPGRTYGPDARLREGDVPDDLLTAG